jgi:hypothetical protein
MGCRIVIALALALAFSEAEAIAEESATPPASEAITPALLPPDHVATRVAAVRRLGEIGGEAATDALLRTLENDPSTQVRVAAIVALGQIGSERARQAIVRVAEEETAWELRTRAAEVLVSMAPTSSARVETVRELGQGRAISSVQELLVSNPDPAVRLEALNQLQLHGSYASMADATRQAAENDASPRVREAAAEVVELESTRRLRERLEVSGVGLLAGAYIWTLLAAGGTGIYTAVYGDHDVALAAYRLLLPIAGPAWAAMAYPNDRQRAWQAIAVIDTIIQAAGAALFITGLAFRARRHRAGAAPAARSPGRALAYSFAWSL